ncbi:alkaline phosphatase family protein [Nocardioides jejuensis]|nr:alkaline phosphatase family protein [Nocardioides jejuensis]
MNRAARTAVALTTLVATVLAAAVLLGVVRGHGGAKSPSADGTIAPAATTTPKVTKVLVIMVENHSLEQMKTGMPKTFAFASKYAYATDYTAITHPSLPNYIAIASGSTYGITDDKGPSAHRLKGRSVFSQALRNGKTARTYADSMPSNCYLSNAGDYAVRHNPWTYFVDSRTGCTKYDTSVKRLATDAANGTLPNVGFLIPNLVHDAHDGTLAQADTWISDRIATLTAGKDWAAGRLAVVITADEDDKKSGNRVLTVVASKYQQKKVVTTHLNHYSLTRFIEQVLHVPLLRHASTAPDMRAAFGVKVS